MVFGRVGTYSTRAGALRSGVRGDLSLWRACAHTAIEHVLNPWRVSGSPVDVFVQSWNPDMAKEMDALWQPMASDHAEQNDSAAALCPIKMKLCERTMWALLGLKRALALRARHESAAGRSGAHATVLVMRHDVYWRSQLPPLRADGQVRLWLPFECQVNYCRDPTGSNTSSCYGRKIPDGASKAPDWLVLKHSQSSYYGRRCDWMAMKANEKTLTFCSNTVLIDWWFVTNATLADGIAETYDEFAEYSSLVQSELHFNLSAPHHYWGLYFFHKHRLRERCELGFSQMHGIDFTLGRFLPEGVDGRSTCGFAQNEPWRPLWQPSRECDAAAIDGYVTMCPEVPTRAVHFLCS